MRQLLRAIGRGVLACACVIGAVERAGASVEPASPQAVQQAFTALPLAFEANEGQADPRVRFMARAPGYRLFLTPQDAVMVFSRGSPQADGEQDAAVLRMRFDGANPDPAVRGEELLDFRTNYFIQGEGARPYTGVRNHGRVRYTGIYPGVDLVYYGTQQQQLEYDLLLAPKADPKRIRIRIDGAERPLTVSAQGDLVIPTRLGDVLYRKPVAYQEIAGERRPVEAAYRIAANGEVGFRLGRYDTRRPLVIDPILSYSSYLWGVGNAVAVDAGGNAYVVGSTGASDVPAATGYLTRLTGSQDAYVAKLDRTGKLLWATYLGARRAMTSGQAVAVDGNGSVYVAGTTNSTAYPVTAGAYQTTWTGGSFLTKLNATGNALVYSTFVNGTTIGALATDGTGNAYMTGVANALATTPGALLPTRPNSSSPSPFVAKLNAAGSAMVYATYLGGSSNDKAGGIAVDAAGSAHVTGTTLSANFPTANAMYGGLRGSRDAYLAKFNATGDLVYSTYLGGSGSDYGHGIALDSAGQVYVVGQSYSDDFPVTAGVFQPRKAYSGPSFPNGFIVKVAAAGNSLIYGSYIGGRWCVRPGVSSCSGGLFAEGDGATAVAVDAAGYAYIGGHSSSAVFPQVDAIQAMPDYISEYQHVVFLAKVTPSANATVYAAVLGERGQDLQVKAMGVDPAGGVFALGYGGYSFPFTAGAQVAQASSSFLVKLGAGEFPTTVRSSANPSSAAQPLTLTADVQGLPIGGTVTFYSGAAVLGTAPVVAGAASLDVTLAAGIHRITAVHSADGKASPALFQQVRGQ
jgi:hypothetical protein